MDAKLSDFGVSRHKNSKVDNLSEYKYLLDFYDGDKTRAPPELYQDKLSSKTDVYMFGQLLSRLLDAVTAIADEHKTSVALLQQIITLCKHADPSKRPTALWIEELFEALERELDGKPVCDP